jgi:hypothetical protein
MSRPRVETPEYLAMLRRMICAAGRRVGDADEPDLAALVALREDLDAAIADAVRGQRSWGRSWASVASGLGVTRQSAHERYATQPGGSGRA